MNPAASLSQSPIFLLVLDAEQDIQAADVGHLLPQHPMDVFRLSEYSPPAVRRSGSEQSPVDWNALASAVVRMVADAKKKATEARCAAERPVYFVYGRAPLPIFSLLAQELSAWEHQVHIINRRKGGTWVSVFLNSAQESPLAFFDKISIPPETNASETEGRIAVFISCLTSLQEPDKDSIRKMIKSRGETIGDIVEICTSEPKDLNETNYSAAQKQLEETFRRIRAGYPRASGMALFIAGPAHLAMMAGRALNPTIYSQVWLSNYDKGSYTFTFCLPWMGGRTRILPQDAEAKLVRSKLLNIMNKGWEEFKATFNESDLPPLGSFPMDEKHRKNFLSNMKTLQPLRELEGDIDEPFQLKSLEDSFTVSPDLLDALHERLDEEKSKIFAQTLILHELFHIRQGLRSASYHGIGRAGIALEEVDYWADAFALGVLTTMKVRDLGKKGERECGKIVIQHTENVLQGIESFDRFDHGDRIERLAERRLRRYLFWHLQHSRAKTLRSPKDIWNLFGKRLFVELSPLEGYLSERGDKFVIQGRSNETELFIVLEGHLMREASSQSFQPEKLIDMIRSYDREAIQRAMEVVRENHAEELVPWKTSLANQ